MTKTAGLTFLIIMCLASGLSSCTEIIEPSVAKRNVRLLAPANNYQTNRPETSFWFEPVEDALKYRLQVVSPSFDSIGQLVLDTLISNNRFTQSMEPGQYQWRVRAENGSSESPFSQPWGFTIKTN